MNKKASKQSKLKEVIIYQAKNGAIELRGDFTHETIWATQAQIVNLFEVHQSVVSRHIKNIFADGEVVEKSNMQKMHNANSDKPTMLYSLDVILSVGYRTNSKIAIDFRKWATSTLRAHIVDGFTINKKRIGENYEMFKEAVDDVRSLLPASYSDTDSIIELITLFSDTWVSLDAYDKDTLSLKKPTKKKIAFTGAALWKDVSILKSELIRKGEATEHFATERTDGGLSGIVGNVLQSLGGKHVYESVEEKAAHLLYFIVKNHPFVDGNKRTGAYAFVWFLRKAKILDITRITPPALTALTLLIAESNPRDKERVVRLVTMLLGK